MKAHRRYTDEQIVSILHALRLKPSPDLIVV